MSDTCKQSTGYFAERMQRKISFCLISDSGTRVKQFTASRTFVRFCAGGIIFLFLLSAFAAYHYFHLYRKSFSNRPLDSLLSQQKHEINSQRRQIQKFAQEINLLKEKLNKLNDSEMKVRAIANLDSANLDSEDQEGFLGIGGSFPEDIDTRVDLDEKHNSLLREMHEQVELLNGAINSQREAFLSLLDHLESQQNMLVSTPAIRPVEGWITSRFGYRKSPFTGKREFHKGLDIAASKKTPIYATADGAVTFVGKKGYLGNLIVIDHGYGIVTRYAHLHKATKKRGETVRRGDVIAQVGSSGRTTGPHLHYEVHLNGIPVNPEKYILSGS